MRDLLAVQLLDQADVADEGHVAAQAAHVRRDDRRVRFGIAARQIEVKLMKLHPRHQLATRLRFKGGERRIAQLLVGAPIAGRDAVQQLLGQGNQLFIARLVHGVCLI